MARPNRLKEIEEEQGEALGTLIPRMLNELGTMTAVAQELGTTMQTIFYWCRDNGIEKKTVWLKQPGNGNSNAS
jgi:hypothetical protein